MAEYSLRVIKVDALLPAENYSQAEMDAFGEGNDSRFNEANVVVIFRLQTADQAMPIRIRLLKSEVPDRDWIGAARAKAMTMFKVLAASSS